MPAQRPCLRAGHDDVIFQTDINQIQNPFHIRRHYFVAMRWRPFPGRVIMEKNYFRGIVFQYGFHYMIPTNLSDQ